jgi:membrane-associated protein
MFNLIIDACHRLADIKGLIELGGPTLICLIVFIETGLFVGFFLPGDSLLVTAGLLAANGNLNFWLLFFLVPLCAMIGDQVGYWIGRRAGQTLYKRDDSFLFKKKHLERAHEFYEKYGGKTIILARFVPIVRTFVQPVAGAAKMKYSRFVAFSIAGGLFWVWSMLSIGYFLGRSIPNIDKYIHIVIIAVIFLSILPALFEVLKQRSKKSGKASSAAPVEKSLE